VPSSSRDFQGGLLLTQAARDVQLLREALDAALTHVASCTVDRVS
jgi:hypothetical protein